ncbi:MAG TPA: DUF4136 domain-containing protein [Bryobacteraceae bacterium]
MKTLKKLLFILPATALLLLAVTRVDYDHTANFSNYKTYYWLKVEAGDSLWQDRIQRDVDDELMAKGWMRVPTGGDAAVSAIGSTHNQQQLDTFYNGLGGGWGWGGFGGFGTATTTVQNIPIGNLVVDIFNANTKKLIWRGTAEKALSGKPAKNEKKLRDELRDMFKNFPPGAKG